MSTNGDARGEELERLRPYLDVVARMHLDHRLRKRFDPEDMVQDAFYKALERWEQCRESRQAWLRQILVNHMKDKLDQETNQKHNIDLERALQQSSMRLDAILEAKQSSPSQRAARNEQVDQLAEALARLPRTQQDVVILHHLHEMTLAETAAELGITPGAAAGLLYRGLRTLNRLLNGA